MNTHIPTQDLIASVIDFLPKSPGYIRSLAKYFEINGITCKDINELVKLIAEKNAINIKKLIDDPENNSIGNKFILHGMSFADLNFEYAYFSDINITECKFINCNFSETSFQGCELINCEFINCKFDNSSIWKNNFQGCKFENDFLDSKFEYFAFNCFYDEDREFIDCKSIEYIVNKIKFCCFEEAQKKSETTGSKIEFVIVYEK